jgi:malonyl-CoA O-methyltransferase
MRQPVVLLHGWGSDSRVFAPLQQFLAGEFELQCVDLPGFGQQAAEEFPLGEGELVAWLRARVPEGAVLVGWSLGGALGIALAAACPGHLSALVTIASNPCFLERPDWPHGMPAAQFETFRAGLQDDPVQQLRQFRALQGLGDLRAREVARSLRDASADPLQPDALLRGLDLLARLDLRACIPSLQLPVLHVLGEHDAIVPSAVATHYEQMHPQASVFRVEGAGHAPLLSRPALLAARIGDFLRGQLSGATPDMRDKRDVARSFGRAAHSYDAVAHLQRDIGSSLLAMMDCTAVARILDLGSGTGHFTARLQQRCRDARIIALDIAEGMLRDARNRPGSAVADAVCGDAEDLPLAGGSIDLVFSNLALQWCETPHGALREIARVLRPGGQAVLSTLGEDSLWELRAAWHAVDDHVHVNRFAGTALMLDAVDAAGLRITGFDQRYHCPRYDDVQSLARELRALGAHNVNSGRQPSLAGRARWRLLQQAYAALADSEGKLPATYRAVCLRLEKPHG